MYGAAMCSKQKSPDDLTVKSACITQTQFEVRFSYCDTLSITLIDLLYFSLIFLFQDKVERTFPIFSYVTFWRQGRKQENVTFSEVTTTFNYLCNPDVLQTPFIITSQMS